MRSHSLVVVAALALAQTALLTAPLAAHAEVTMSKEEIVEAIVRGAGLLPGQDPSPTASEIEFRARMEARKDAMLSTRAPVAHPTFRTAADWDRARRAIAESDWARAWYEEQKEVADYVLAQPEGYVEAMLVEETPWFLYGFTCPNCVGRLSQIGSAYRDLVWDYRNPDVFACGACGQTYPDPQFPAEAILEAPRSGQSFAFFLNPEQRANPDNRTGELAWRWVGHPMHMNFSGMVLSYRNQFMIRAATGLASQYGITGDPRYAEKAAEILVRLAHCYRQWLYHDYWGTIADCDPLYAAWNRMDRIEWKRHLATSAYQNDELDRAAMKQDYWGAGRYSATTDAVSTLRGIAFAYDQIHDATDAQGRPIWTEAMRSKVERDLFLEWILGSEPFVGGEGEAKETNNKAPRVYAAMAAVARVLGVVNYAEVALRGYEGIRDEAFLYDGFSRESASYTNMYLTTLVQVPEVLDGFVFPETGATRTGTVRIFEDDAKLELMFRAMLDTLQPDGTHFPLDDTAPGRSPSPNIPLIGLHRYPQHFLGRVPLLMKRERPTEYALFNCRLEDLTRDDGDSLPEIYFPAWMTPILRHGRGPLAAALAINNPPAGGHRNRVQAALFYVDQGRTVLGDNGYCGDHPAHGWNASIRCHNLVVVDDAGHAHFQEREPSLHRFVATPGLSVTEVSSATAYPQCRDYRRLTALVKGPGNQTFAFDVFTVKGGDRHDFRIFSEIGTSDDPDNRIAFDGLALPNVGPLANIGATVEREWIFGLRDIRTDPSPPAAWQAIWSAGSDAYRLWMLTPADEASVSNMPAQQMPMKPGRRAHVVDTTRIGENLESVFVAVHEPNGLDGAWILRRVERLRLPDHAGPDAVAVRVEAAWGDYLFLVQAENAIEVEDVRFQGAFGAVFRDRRGGGWLMASEAALLTVGEQGLRDIAPVWSGAVDAMTADHLTTSTPRPANWPADNPAVLNHVRIHDGRYHTGFPVAGTGERRIDIDRFPLQETGAFALPVAVYQEIVP